MCLIDSRVKIINTDDNGRLNTIDYDSDHNVIQFVVKVQTRLSEQFFQPKINIQHIYKKTNWNKFNKTLAKKININVPEDLNLSNDQIDNFIRETRNAIQETIKEVVPPRRAANSVDKYMTPKISKLKKLKNQQINLAWCLKVDPLARRKITKDTNALLLLINKQLRTECRSAITTYWTNFMKSINYKDTNKFFLTINKNRSKNHHEQESNLLVDMNDHELLQRGNIDRDRTPQENNQYIIYDAIDKLNIFGAHYERINSPCHLDSALRLKKLVLKTVSKIKKSWENSTNNLRPYTTSSNYNPASNPRINHNVPKYLCNTPQVASIFKKLPNKSSSGPDNTPPPPIILKHLLIKIIKRYTIIFNNLLNNYYFPQDWKLAKVIPILKKGKQPTSVRWSSSYQSITCRE